MLVLSAADYNYQMLEYDYLAYYAETVQQGNSASVLESCCPGELSYNPYQTHLREILKKFFIQKFIPNLYDWLSSAEGKLQKTKDDVSMDFHCMDKNLLCFLEERNLFGFLITVGAKPCRK